MLPHTKKKEKKFVGFKSKMKESREQGEEAMQAAREEVTRLLRGYASSKEPHRQ